MSEIRLYNTLSRRLDPFTPVHEGEARVYVCGPTVYDAPHIGNARPPVVFDVLTRHLAARGYRVTYVRNITDIDDKILARAKANGEEPTTLAGRVAPVYKSQMRELGCKDPTHEPKVSEHLPEIFAIIERLLSSGAAYEMAMPSGARDVYYAVRGFSGYGKLSRRNIDELIEGARVEKDESKRDPLDFALWKGTTADGWGWPSPWGKGRPGWHIECSAMSERYLGFGFDIHGGGMDMIFPHHENEIAQSEAACPKRGDFCRIWMHNGFINVNQEKMSKSLGNMVKPTDIYQNNDPVALRYMLLTVHYRGPLSLDVETAEDGRVVFPGVDEAERRVDYLYATLDRLDSIARDGEPDAVKELAPYAAIARSARDKVAEALDDDLNTPVALAHVAEIAKASNDVCDMVKKRHKDASFVEAGGRIARLAAEALRSSADVLGMLQVPAAEYASRTRARRLLARKLDAAAIEEKVVARTRAREQKDWARADAIRAELAAWGIDVSDTAGGARWTVKV
jgi:cysteinyl-tRNA synthetase